MTHLTFESWMDLVNTGVENLAGISVHDLPDCPFEDWYNDEYTPAEAAEEALIEAGYPEEAL